MKHKQVSKEEIEKIILTRRPKGTFWAIENEIYVAVDNLTGDVWMENFEEYSDCMDYLDESLYYVPHSFSVD